MPEQAVLRVVQQDGTLRARQLRLCQGAECGQDLGNGLAGRDHLQHLRLLPKDPLRLLALVDVLGRAVPAGDGSRRIPPRGRTGAAPAVSTVGGPDAVFALVGSSGAETRAPRLEKTRQVVRVNERRPAVADQFLGRLADPLVPSWTDLNDPAFSVGERAPVGSGRRRNDTDCRTVSIQCCSE